MTPVAATRGLAWSNLIERRDSRGQSAGRRTGPGDLEFSVDIRRLVDARAHGQVAAPGSAPTSPQGRRYDFQALAQSAPEFALMAMRVKARRLRLMNKHYRPQVASR
jgi:hypothetical protein